MNSPRFPKPSWLGQIGLAVTSVLAIAAGFILASLLFTALLIAGLVGAIWLWWQWRKVVQQVRAAAPDIIEGEYTVEPSRPLLEDLNAANHNPTTASSPRQDS